MGLSAFKKTWRELLPFILTAKSMTDLCSTCQVNNTLIYRSKNMDETNKSKRLKDQMVCLFYITYYGKVILHIYKIISNYFFLQVHLERVQTGRAFYNSQVDQSRDICRELGISTLGRKGDIPMAHYSFDYAQNIHLPSDPMQCGPLYFLAPRKVGIFGVCAEGIPKQVIIKMIFECRILMSV